MVTERNRRERELQEQNRKLDRFASFVSHDLRNPLTIARGYLDTGIETGDEEAFEEVGAALHRIDELVTDLLTLARGGRTIDEQSAISLAACAEAAWENVHTGDATLVVEGDLRLRRSHDRPSVGEPVSGGREAS